MRGRRSATSSAARAMPSATSSADCSDAAGPAPAYPLTMTSASQTPSDTPRFSAEDIEIATALLMQPLEEPVTEIVSLTDEELMALEGVEHDPLTPTPWMTRSAADDDARALATAAAMRSMIA